MNLADRKKFWRYARAAATFSEVASGCQDTAELDPNSSLYVFAVFGLITTYFQPFTSQSGGTLEKQVIPDNSDARLTHENAEILRDNLIAHCDMNFSFDSRRFNIDASSSEGQVANSSTIELTTNTDWKRTRISASRPAYYLSPENIRQFGEHNNELAKSCAHRALLMLKPYNVGLHRQYAGKKVRLAVNVHLPSDSRLLIPTNEYERLCKLARGGGAGE